MKTEDRFPELGSRMLVIYDERCGLCNRSVRWFRCYDAHDRLRFIQSESLRVVDLLGRTGLTSPDLSDGPTTILAVRNPATFGTHLQSLCSCGFRMGQVLRQRPESRRNAHGLVRRNLTDLGIQSFGRLVLCSVELLGLLVEGQCVGQTIAHARVSALSSEPSADSGAGPSCGAV